MNRNPARSNSCCRAIAFAVLIFCALACARPAHAALGRIECNSVPSAILHRPVRYCAILPPSYDSQKSRRYPILYFLHGLGSNEQFLVVSGGWNIVEDEWQQKKIGEFLIVTPAADTTFYINSRDGRVRYEDFFLREFIPFIESHYRVTAKRADRAIGGISMGGYGALHLAFAHPKLFVSVTANSAALFEKLPNVRVANPQQSPLLRALHAFGIPPDPAFWRRNDPLRLARVANLSGLRIYFDCGAEDDYGFEYGAQALHDVLAARKIRHEFHLYPGHHDAQYFAAHLPAVMEFQSRELGLAHDRRVPATPSSRK
ncbi:MAG TPA: alpha/beta hydrolase family protein [Candidatus Acidoferrales bacterium]|nr:alpha/beta hydrolase family protein [Candidatus Acidoferrales bacterium]